MLAPRHAKVEIVTYDDLDIGITPSSMHEVCGTNTASTITNEYDDQHITLRLLDALRIGYGPTMQAMECITREVAIRGADAADIGNEADLLRTMVQLIQSPSELLKHYAV